MSACDTDIAGPIDIYTADAAGSASDSLSLNDFKAKVKDLVSAEINDADKRSLDFQVRHYPGQDLFEVTYRVFNSESGEQDDNGHCNVNFRVRNSSSLPLSFKGGRSDISYRGPLQVTTRGIATSLLQKMKTDQGDEYEMLSSIPQTVKGVLSALFEHVRTIPGLDNDPEVDYGSDANWEVQDFDDKTRYSIKGALFDQSGTEVKPGVIVRFDLLKKKNGD